MNQEFLFIDENFEEKITCLFESTECKNKCDLCPRDWIRNKKKEKENVNSI